MNKIQEAKETKTAQMAHPQTQTAQALPESEDVAERVWTRGLSAVLKVAERAIQERNTYIDINSTTTLNKPTTAPFPTAHGHSSEEIFSNDIWTDTRQKAHSLINGIAWPDTWGPLLPLVNHPTSAEITLSITESRSQQTCLTKRRKSQHPALIRLWVMLQQGCTKTDLCLMAWKPTCLQLRVTTIARRSLANLNHLQCRNDLQYQPAIRNTTLCLPLPINMVSQTNKTWHRTLPLSASRTSCL